MFGVTAAQTAEKFLAGQLRAFHESGWRVSLVCGEQSALWFSEQERIAESYVVRAHRRPSPIDVLTLKDLVQAIAKERPDVVVFGTPKVGVFGTLAAWIMRVKTRCYLVHGYRGEIMRGPLGLVVRSLDKIACKAATQVLVVSKSLRAKLIADGITSSDRADVLGSGSANGVDASIFHPASQVERDGARDDFGIPRSAEVVAQVGRLTHDKGLRDLVQAWQTLSQLRPDVWLILAGAEEPSSQVDEELIERLHHMPRVIMVGALPDVVKVYHATDVLIFLTMREGLGMVALEAAACEVPCVTYAVTGVVDAVTAATGIVVPVHRVDRVVREVVGLLDAPSTRSTLGSNGRERVLQQFEAQQVQRNWLDWADKSYLGNGAIK